MVSSAGRSLTVKKKMKWGITPVLPLFSLGYPGLWDCSPSLHRHTNVALGYGKASPWCLRPCVRRPAQSV